MVASKIFYRFPSFKLIISFLKYIPTVPSLFLFPDLFHQLITQFPPKFQSLPSSLVLSCFQIDPSQFDAKSFQLFLPDFHSPFQFLQDPFLSYSLKIFEFLPSSLLHAYCLVGDHFVVTEEN